MKVVDQTQQPTRTTTLNDIPVGQVFRGEVLGVNSGHWTYGVFYKAHGPSGVRGVARGSNPEREADVVVVRIDTAKPRPGYANLWLFCAPVRQYEPLDVELVVKGAVR